MTPLDEFTPPPTRLRFSRGAESATLMLTSTVYSWIESKMEIEEESGGTELGDDLLGAMAKYLRERDGGTPGGRADLAEWIAAQAGARFDGGDIEEEDPEPEGGLPRVY